MPNAHSDQEQRRHAIRELLGGGPVATQQLLVTQLARRGFTATQSSVSRDLREIGVVKSPWGYAVSPAGAALATRRRELVSGLRGLIESVDRGGTLAVIRTKPGHGGPVARQLEDADLHEILGVVSDTGTVFVATRASAHARELVRVLGEK